MLAIGVRMLYGTAIVPSTGGSTAASKGSNYHVSNL